MDAPPSNPAPPELRSALALRAGPLSLRFDQGDLRYVTWSGREVVRRIYGAVRDHDWNTVAGVISGLECRRSVDAFRVAYTSTHRQGDVHFVWRADIQGGTDGSIRFTFDGEARSTFLRNRIGFCVLHPIRECAGAACRARYANGTRKASSFPDMVAAEQPVKWLHDLLGLDHQVAPGVWAELEFEGELFEMEDQRNWIDASFKTYCTPLRLPFPMEVPAGTRIRQEVRLRLASEPRVACDTERGMDHARGSTDSGPGLVESGVVENRPVFVRLASGVSRLPALGLGLPDTPIPMDAVHARRLRLLGLSHVRVDLRLWQEDWPGRLERAVGDGTGLGTKLEVALHLNEAPDAALGQAAAMLSTCRNSVIRVLVLHRNRESTTPTALRAARTALTAALPGVLLGVGTDADLYQLNLQRPPAEDADFVGWSMNPQVHAFDDASIAETPEAAGHQVTSVRRYFPGKPLVVSPVTLRPRFNANATGPAPVVPPGELPASVDPRQVSLFGAAWTVAMVKALAEAGADAATFYETIGWRGVMETTLGSPIPNKFPSIPGAVFPLYHVLADVAEFAGGDVTSTVTSEPLAVASLLLRRGERRRLLLANLASEPRAVVLDGLGSFRPARCLDSASRHQAMTQPEVFRSSSVPDSKVRDLLEIAPWAIVTLDFAVP